jgi:hypothetical protein
MSERVLAGEVGARGAFAEDRDGLMYQIVMYLLIQEEGEEI